MSTQPRILRVGEEPPPLGNAGSPPSPNGDRKPGAKRAAAGRFATLNAFVDVALKDLSRAEIAVWLVLYRDIKARDGSARASYDGLARRAGCDRRTVGRALRRLERLGLVQVMHRGGLGRGTSRYRVRASPRGYSPGDTGVPRAGDISGPGLGTPVSHFPEVRRPSPGGLHHQKGNFAMSTSASGKAGAARRSAPLDCQTCGACCVSYLGDAKGYVTLTDNERRRVRRLGLPVVRRGEERRLGTVPYAGEGGERICAAFGGTVGEPCGCTIYPDRPRECRDF
jgi:hypothetical protein